MVAIGLAFLAGPLRAEFVYVANFLNNISAFSIGENGVLTPVAGSPFSTGFPENQFFPSYSLSVAVDPLGRFVYVTNTGIEPALNGSVSAFRIGANGALTPVTGSPFRAGSFSGSVAVDFLDRYVYVANADNNTVSGYRIGVNGALTPVPGSPFPAGNLPASVAVDLLRRFVYVANAFGNTVSAYRIGVNGALKPVACSPFPTGIEPESVAVDLLGRFVYTANHGDFPPNGSVSAYRISAEGALTPVRGSPFTAGFTASSEPSSVAVDPWGRFVYVINSYLGNSVSAYRIGANGALTPVPGSPFPAGDQPVSVAFSP